MTSESVNSVEKKEIESKAKVLILGTFTSEDIETVITDHQMPHNTELDHKIETEWAPKAAKGWFAGPLARVENFELTNQGKLRLTFGRTDFREYSGSRNLEDLRKFGYEGISNPLSSSTVLATADGKLVISVKLQGDKIGAVDAIGGYTHPGKDTNAQTGKIDIFQTAKREVLEESLVSEGELSDIVCLGLSYEYAGLCHPVASFVAKTPLTADEIKGRIAGKEEEVHLIVVDPVNIPQSEEPEYVMSVLSQAYPNVEPDGRITIALARKWISGKEYPKKLLRTEDQI